MKAHDGKAWKSYGTGILGFGETSLKYPSTELSLGKVTKDGSNRSSHRRD